MRACLADAGLKSERVDYINLYGTINLHGTAIRANDEAEAMAVLEVFGGTGQADADEFDQVDAGPFAGRDRWD